MQGCEVYQNTSGVYCPISTSSMIIDTVNLYFFSCFTMLCQQVCTSVNLEL